MPGRFNWVVGLRLTSPEPAYFVTLVTSSLTAVKRAAVDSRRHADFLRQLPHGDNRQRNILLRKDPQPLPGFRHFNRSIAVSTVKAESDPGSVETHHCDACGDARPHSRDDDACSHQHRAIADGFDHLEIMLVQQLDGREVEHQSLDEAMMQMLQHRRSQLGKKGVMHGIGEGRDQNPPNLLQGDAGFSFLQLFAPRPRA